jgi:AcrR family transcriptional regulator
MFVKTSRKQTDWHDFFNGSPSADGMGRRERRGAETRERLFRSAMNLFRERGFQNTTVEDITNAADVGKGTFFNYFPSKEHILGVLGEVQVGKYHKAAAMARDGETRDALYWLYHALPAESGSSPKMVRSLFTVFLTSEPVREFLTGGLTGARVKLKEMFREAQNRGEIPNHLNPQDLAFRFQQSLFGSMFLWTLQNPAPALEPWLDGGFDFFWSGVTAPPAKRGTR